MEHSGCKWVDGLLAVFWHTQRLFQMTAEKNITMIAFKFILNQIRLHERMLYQSWLICNKHFYISLTFKWINVWSATYGWSFVISWDIMSSINIKLEKCGGVATNWAVWFHWKWLYENTFNLKANFQFCIIIMRVLMTP